MAKRGYLGKDDNYITVKQNRNTTLESLEAVVKLILADNESEFIHWYSIATHDNNSGATCWYYLQKESEPREEKRKYQREYYEKNKDKFKWYKEKNKAIISARHKEYYQKHKAEWKAKYNNKSEIKPIEEDFNFE